MRFGLQGSAKAILAIALAVFFLGCGGQSSKTPRTGGQAVEIAEGNQEQNLASTSQGELSLAQRGDPGPSSDKLPVGPEDPVWGSPNAPITVVSFQDYQCPFCARVQGTLQQVQNHYGPERLRIVFKHNPLPFHKDAKPAALAAQAVFRLAGLDAFLRYSKKLYANSRSLSDENLISWAEAEGISHSALFRMVRDPLTLDKVDADIELAKTIGDRGTPAFRINGIQLSGAQNFSKFKSTIDTELSAVEKLRSSGVPPDQVYSERVNKNLSLTQARPKWTPRAQDTKTVWKVPVGKSPALGPQNCVGHHHRILRLRMPVLPKGTANPKAAQSGIRQAATHRLQAQSLTFS